MRNRLVPVFAFLLAVGAIAVTIVLQDHADSSQRAQLRLATVKIELNQLQNVPFQAIKATGGSPTLARERMTSGERVIRSTVGDLQRESAPAPLSAVPAVLDRNYATLQRIYAIGVNTGNYGPRADHLSGVSGRSVARATTMLNAASRVYAARAGRAATKAIVGAAAAILLLLGAFAFYYLRSTRVARENRRLLLTSREEALHDALTGLGNRRALISDLTAAIPPAASGRALALSLFDLDGFKHYNDSFGHPAGDALLARLGKRLASATEGIGSAYRLGGDEFCVLSSVDPGEAEKAARVGATALTEAGDGFEIGCSYGFVEMPADASTEEEGLRLADQRMYTQKAARGSAGRRSTDALLEVLGERSVGLSEHVNRVAELAEQVARRVSLPDSEVRQVHLGAELHDIGKSAIPDAILNKPGPLDGEEWELMRRHPLIGERIILAVPALREAAKLVRFSHEQVDGKGYPDRIAGGEIPLGSRIIAVCDAFDAMTSDRPYRSAVSVAAALAELRRCAGTQFDPLVVDALCPLVEESSETVSIKVERPPVDPDRVREPVPVGIGAGSVSDRFSW
jgi:diguanylate cyclase (GGDEF)-like protein